MAKGEIPLENYQRLAVVGAGPAGSSLAWLLYQGAREQGRALNIEVLDLAACSLCSGLLTRRAVALYRRVWQEEIPEAVVQDRATEVVYVNPAGAVVIPLEKPALLVRRTSKHGLPGLDDLLRQRLVTLAQNQGLGPVLSYQDQVEVEQVTALPGARGGAALTYRSHGTVVRQGYQVAALCCGLGRHRAPLVSGYQTPPSLPASVTQVSLVHKLKQRLMVADGLLPGVTLALLPGDGNWVSVVALNRWLTREDLHTIVQLPILSQYWEPPGGVKLRCGRICRARIHTGPARSLAGRGWLAVGDSGGYGRVFKDGYTAAFEGALLAAETLLEAGVAPDTLRQRYAVPLRGHARKDNLVGKWLFNLDAVMSRQPWFARWLLAACHGAPGHPKTRVATALEALNTAQLSYSNIAVLFLWGLLLEAWPPRSHWSSLHAAKED